MKQYDYCRTLLKNFCKVNNISPKRIRFQNIENLVVINIKNHLKVGVDLDCFKILNIINQTVVPLGIKFNQQLYLYPNGDRLARVAIIFNKDEYVLLNKINNNVKKLIKLDKVRYFLLKKKMTALMAVYKPLG